MSELPFFQAYQRDVDRWTEEHSENGYDEEMAFVTSLQEAVTRIQDNVPGGSPRYGVELGIKGLRHVKMEPHSKFAFLVFYVAQADGSAKLARLALAEGDIPPLLRYLASEP